MPSSLLIAPDRPGFVRHPPKEQRASRSASRAGRCSYSGHETAWLRVAVRARPYGRSTGTGAFAENVVGQAVLDGELRARAVSVAAPATLPGCAASTQCATR